ncbi:uncharacterized protein LOC108664334 [Hyalella azteca]|uniref:Uncharacterized protein LOC108664334 n=1 Tax=Hyalella azteca TaxID=294128 RepID=A0A8B7MZL5_HYAAZ|nr:uncharacterized protein LOC108664334 [Hyalella azteca]
MRGTTDIMRKKNLYPPRNGNLSLDFDQKNVPLKSSNTNFTNKSNHSRVSLGEKCSNCHRTFRDSEHLTKHKRGALCRRLVQKVARQNRKLANKLTLKSKNVSLPSNSVGPRKKSRVSRPASMTHKPYQCSVCGARFCDKVNVELHCERHHNANSQLWVEVTRGQDIRSVSDLTNNLQNNSLVSPNEATIDASASRTYVMATSTASVDGASSSALNYVSSRLMPLERIKCPECNTFFHSELQLHEHKKVSHQSLLNNCIESSSHMLFHQTSHAPVLNRGITPLNNPNPNCQQYLGPNVGTIDTNVSNLSLNQPLLPTGYIFPAPAYYSHDPNSSMQQNIVHPHLSYMQPQHPVHPHLIQHQTEMQQQNTQQDQTPQHNDQIHAESNNHLQHQPSHLLSQDLLLSSLQQPNQPQPTLQPSLPHHSAQHGGHLAHASTIAPQYSSSIILDLPTSNLPSSGSSSELPSLMHNNITGVQSGMNISVVASSASHSVPSSLSGNNNCINASSVPSVACSSTGFVSSPCSLSTSSNRVVPTPKTLDKSDSNVITKWNMCSECGVKFIDLMNLELHVEKKHPLLSILGSVDFKDGTICYKTGTSIAKSLSRNTAVPSKSVMKDLKIPQCHSCCLCNHSTTSLSPMVEHMMSVHGLSGKAMVDSISSEEGASDYCPAVSRNSVTKREVSRSCDAISTMTTCKPTRPPAHQEAGKTLDPSRPLGEDSCLSCLTNFNSAAELIRHRIKDKVHICGVCCYVTCSRKVLTAHMRSDHDLDDSSGSFSAVLSDLKKQLSCWRCKNAFQKTSEFINHLKIHGSLSGRCEKCGKQDNNIANILIHMTTLHPDFMNRLAITVTSNGVPSTCSYLQTLTGDLLDASCLESRGKTDTSGECSTGDKRRNKSKKRISFIDEVNTSCGSGKNKSSAKADDDRRTYACSQCLICFYGTSSLEIHLKEHEDLGSSGHLPTLANIKRSPSEERLTSSLICPPDAQKAGIVDRSKVNTGKSKANLKVKSGDGKKIGLSSLPSTSGFKCEECGLTKDSSEVMVSHIQKVHMSGNLIHMVAEKKGATKEYPIYIVTPISAN